MTCTEAMLIVTPYINMVQDTEDAALVVHFSKSEDQYSFVTENVEAEDALLIISTLIKKFNLLPEAIITMNNDAKDLSKDM